MANHTRIRIAVSHLKGAARAEAVEYLLHHPEKLKSFGRLRNLIPKDLPTYHHRKGHVKREVMFAFRISADEYVNLKQKAKDAHMSMSGYVKWMTGI